MSVALFKSNMVHVLWLVAMLVPLPMLAQNLRDPTVPPAAATPALPGDVSRLAVVDPGAVAVLVRDGVPYLVVGTRLYAEGQRLGQAKIERIKETEVWMREDGMVRKIAVFGGIQRQVHAPSLAGEQSARPVPKAVQKKH